MIKITINKTDILRSADQIKLMENLFGHKIEFNKKYCSPLREDKHPQCNFWMSPSGILYFVDWAINAYYDAIDIAVQLHGKSPLEAFKMASRHKNRNPVIPTPKNDNDYDIKYVRTVYKNDYFSQYKIPSEVLREYSIIPVRTVLLGNSVISRGTERNPLYVEIAENKSIKLYKPKETKDKKWRMFGYGDTFFGLNTLSSIIKGQPVFITSSCKDAACIRAAGFVAIAPQSEISKLPDRIISLLKDYLVIVLYDNDPPGMSAETALCNRYKYYSGALYKYNLNDKIKDIADLRKYSYKKQQKILKKMISNATRSR